MNYDVNILAWMYLTDGAVTITFLVCVTWVISGVLRYLGTRTRVKGPTKPKITYYGSGPRRNGVPVNDPGLNPRVYPSPAPGPSPFYARDDDPSLQPPRRPY